MKLLINISCHPGSDTARQALDVCRYALTHQHQLLRVFFMGDGVETSRAQDFPVAKEWEKLISEHNIDAVCCINSLTQAGQKNSKNHPIPSSGQESIGPFAIGGLGVLVESAVKADHIINFPTQQSTPNLSLDTLLQADSHLEHSPKKEADQEEVNCNIILQSIQAPSEEAFSRLIDCASVFLAFDIPVDIVICDNSPIESFVEQHKARVEQLVDMGLNTLSLLITSPNKTSHETSNLIEGKNSMRQVPLSDGRILVLKGMSDKQSQAWADMRNKRLSF